MIRRKPYPGLIPKLLLAFDVGTTYSGISYCILEHDKIPQPRSVTKFPGQPEGNVDVFKMPSVLYYDPMGNLKKIGWEALTNEVIEQAMDEGWVKLEWWKLHLRPKHLSSKHIKDDDIPPLPPNKTVVDVFADFTKYLFRCAETHIRESHPSNIWESVKNEIKFVFTHPNGWDGAPQQQMWNAIELSGIVPYANTPRGRTRVYFLTEGEAGLHFCVWELFASKEPDQSQYLNGQGVVIVDAGGGTLDLSMYSMKVNQTPPCEEIVPAECRLQGALFVTLRAKALLQTKLACSRYDIPETIQAITKTFDETTKLHIANAEKSASINLGNGNVLENDPAHNISEGDLKISGQEATQLFDDSIRAVTNTLEQQWNNVTLPITTAFLIGGFGENDWLLSQLEVYFKSKGIKLYRPIRPQKAAPDGAISFLIDRLVRSRVARATYGINFEPFADETNSEHLSRKSTWYTNASGKFVVPNGFQAILHKGVQANDRQKFNRSFAFNRETQLKFGAEETVSIMCYRGSSSDPQWTDRESESFSTLCKVQFDLRQAAKSLSPITRADGRGYYYSLDFEVIIFFGGAEFSAQVAWKVNGVEIRSPAAMIYDED